MGAAEWTEVKRRRTSSAPLANRQVGTVQLQGCLQLSKYLDTTSKLAILLLKINLTVNRLTPEELAMLQVLSLDFHEEK